MFLLQDLHPVQFGMIIKIYRKNLNNMPENKIQFDGNNLNEVTDFLGDKFVQSFSIGGQTVIEFNHAGNTRVVADIWDVFTKGEAGDIYLESRIVK